MRSAPQLFRLSASALSVFLDCKHCFWLQVHEDIRRPQGPFPSLPGGMDAMLKRAMDDYRKRGALPPELRGLVHGKLFADQAQLDRWRDALRGELRHVAEDLGIEVVGGIDDLAEEPTGVTPIDFKTRGWPIKDDSHVYYQHQLNIYVWLLKKRGCRISGRGVLLFFSPRTYEGKGIVTFRIEPVVMKTSPEDAEHLLRRAADILQGALPERDASCAFCQYFTNRSAPEFVG